MQHCQYLEEAEILLSQVRTAGGRMAGEGEKALPTGQS